MVKIEHVQKAQGDWQSPINLLIDVLNGGGNLAFTRHPGTDLDFQNGFSDAGSWYYTLTADDLKFVFLFANINGSGSTDDKFFDKIAFQVPDDIRPLADSNSISPGIMGKSATQTQYVHLSASGHLHVGSLGNETTGQAGYHATLFYLAQN